MRKAMAVVAMVATLMSTISVAGADSPTEDIRTGLQEHGNQQDRTPEVVTTYTVRTGDTLTGVFPLRWRYVCVVNQANRVIQSCDLIRPGQVLDRVVTPTERAAIDRWMAAVPRPAPQPRPRVNAPEPTEASEPASTAPTPTDYGSGSGCDYAIPCDIVMCESGGSYDAENPTSSASGAYQITDGTWGGYGGYSHASDAPPAVQDERAAQIYAGGAGRGNWVC